MSGEYYGVMQFDDVRLADQDLFVPSGFGITRLGIKEYKRVVQHLCCYKLSEIASIKNIFAREYSEKSTRRLRMSETTMTSSEEVEQEQTSDMSTESRFDMSTEVSEVLSEQKQFGAHANMNAQYGAEGGPTIGVDVGANYSQNSSKEKSTRDALNFSQNITQKATDRLTSKVKTERVKKVREEFEEQNKSGFDNRQGADHINGIKRFLDKIYKNELRNYGVKNLYEFTIPESSMLQHLALSSSEGGNIDVKIEKPPHPADDFPTGFKLQSPKDIDQTNYLDFAARYGADVESIPPEFLVVAKGLAKNNGMHTQHTSETADIRIPDGYGVHSAVVGIDKVVHKSGDFSSIVSVGASRKWAAIGSRQDIIFSTDDGINFYTDTIPISVGWWETHTGIANFEITLKRKPEYFDEWKLSTYNTVYQAYAEKLKIYEDAVAQAKAALGEELKINPAFYQDIIKFSLKYHCIQYLVGHANVGKDFIFNDGTLAGVHILQSQEMDQHAALAKFIEQAIDWNIMDYIFYPSYWGAKSRFEKLYLFTDDDKQYNDFMKNGLTRVILTLRDGFEEAFQLYLETGIIWNGSEAPTVDDDLYLSILDEKREPEYTVEETWESRVPSSLTLLQSGSVELNADGLPCWCAEGEDEPDEEIKNSDALKDLEIHLAE